MAKWTVTYIDNDSPDYQFASFKSKRDADIWILNQQQHSRYDANGFEVVDGPHDESKPRKNYPRKPIRKSKIWIDRFRPAPKGYDHIESVMDLDCMNYYVGLDGIFLIDIDGGKDEDGKDLIDDGLQYIADRVDRPIYVRFHGNDPKRKSKVDDAIKEYGWRHAYQSLHEELNEDDGIMPEDSTAILDLYAQYEPPYTLEQIKAKYPEHIYRKLANDPVHRWRAETGIELIHKEPTEEELDRIWKNWQLMPQDMKDISDKKSIEMFGCTNAEHYAQLKHN